MPRQYVEAMKKNPLKEGERHASQSWVKVWNNMQTMMDL